MPGYVIHLALAKRVVDICGITDEDYKEQFFLGNIVPDTPDVSGKRYSHFWTGDMYERFVRVPDLATFKDIYGDLLYDPYILGYYAHLYLDVEFLRVYWKTHFSFYNDGLQEEDDYHKVSRVLLQGGHRMYSREEFFSTEMYYGDYDRMNDYFIYKYNISIPKSCLVEDKIKELDVAIANEKLPHMIEKLTGCSGSVDIPELKVFEIHELEELIESVAKDISELVKMYRIS